MSLDLSDFKGSPEGATNREEIVAKMTMAKQARRRAESITKEESLLPELYVVRNMLHHPLVIQTHIDPDHAVLINARYREVSGEAEAALEKGDWSTHIILHEKPYRLWALGKCVDFGLSGREYWELVGEVWVDSESIRQNLRKWRRAWCSGEPGREACMDEKERAALDDLPDWFRVWRGTAYQRSVRGLSWTTDREKAESFARRFACDTPPLVAAGTVAKKDVRAVFLDRNESEVVSLGVRIEKVTPLGPLAVESEATSAGELLDQLRSGAATELRSALRFKG